MGWSEPLWGRVGCSGGVLDIVGLFDMLWVGVRCGLAYDVVGGCEMVLVGMGRCGGMCDIVGAGGTLWGMWDIVGGCEILWVGL